MKRKLTKAFSLIIAAILACSFGFGCGGNDDIVDNPTSDDSATNTAATQISRGKGVHTASVTPTNEYIVKNGKSDYKLLLPSEATEYEKEAAELIQEYIYASLNVTLPIAYDNEANALKGKIISLGDTELMRSSGISVDVDSYGTSGFKIVTKNGNVYISGARNALRQGTYYGAQEFLKHTIGFETYSFDCIDYEVLGELKLYDFDVTEIPDFDSRRVGYYNLQNDKKWARLLRNEILNEAAVTWAGGSHNHLQILPPSIYYAEHPDWFWFASEEDEATLNVGHGGLCFSNEEMTEEFIKVVTQAFLDNPDKNFVHLGIMDTMYLCECDKCEAKEAEYGTNGTGLYVMFMNTVARAVQKRVQEVSPDRRLTFQMFAYNAAVVPPAHIDDKTGKYVPDCDEVVLDDNVIVQFTPAHRNENVQLEGTSENTKFWGYLQGWHAVAKQISVWSYDINFKAMNLKYQNWVVLIDDMITYSDMGVRRMYLQGSVSQPVASMIEMRCYVESKLMWNLSLDYEELVKDFIEHYYGPAAESVAEYYDVMTSYFEHLSDELGVTGSLYQNLYEERYWSFAYVDSVRRIYENAFKSIENIDDDKLYEQYYWRVCSAYLENLFLQLEYHKSSYDENYCLNTIDLFEKICDKLGIYNMSEGDDKHQVTNYLNKWRAAYA